MAVCYDEDKACPSCGGVGRWTATVVGDCDRYVCGRCGAFFKTAQTKSCQGFGKGVTIMPNPYGMASMKGKP